jgi:ubiquitin
MSVNVNITVTVPLETVTAILSSSSPDNIYVVTPQIASATRKAIVEAVKALPYEIKPKSNPPIKTNTSTTISVVVGMATGKRFTIDNVASKAKASELVNRIQDEEGIPPHQQRLIYNSKLLYCEYDDNTDTVDMSLDEV